MIQANAGLQVRHCVNCGHPYSEDGCRPISKVDITFLPKSLELEEGPLDSQSSVDTMDDAVRSTGSVTILDGLLSIFSDPSIFYIKESFHDNVLFTMCFQCAKIFSSFYQSFIELLTVSVPTSEICQLIPRIRLWHGESIQKGDKDDSLGTRTHFEAFMKAILSSNLFETTDLMPITRSKDKLSSSESVEAKSLSIQPGCSRSVRFVDPNHKQHGKRKVKDSSTSTITKLLLNFKEPKVVLRKCDATTHDESEQRILNESYRLESKCSTVLESRKRRKEVGTRKRGPHSKVKCSVEDCQKQFLYHWLMNNHVRRDHEKKAPFECNKCAFTTFDIEGFESHFCKSREEQTWEENLCRFFCEFCNHPHPSKSALIQHARTHDRAIIKCSFPDCDKSFLRKRHLDTHERLCHGVSLDIEDVGAGVVPVLSISDQFQCSECGKIFLSRTRFNIHLEIHSAERKYLCNRCGMSFKQRRALVRHNIIHKDVESIRLHTCLLCQKQFKRRYNLTQHYHSKVHPRAIVEKLMNGEKLNDAELQNVSTRRTRIIKEIKQVGESETVTDSFVVLPLANAYPFGKTNSNEGDIEAVHLKHVEQSQPSQFQLEPFYVTTAVLPVPNPMDTSTPVPPNSPRID